jgi:hypothetical protein
MFLYSMDIIILLLLSISPPRTRNSPVYLVDSCRRSNDVVVKSRPSYACSLVHNEENNERERN